jgi:hypothetical protein
MSSSTSYYDHKSKNHFFVVPAEHLGPDQLSLVFHKSDVYGDELPAKAKVCKYALKTNVYTDAVYCQQKAVQGYGVQIKTGFIATPSSLIPADDNIGFLANTVLRSDVESRGQRQNAKLCIYYPNSSIDDVQISLNSTRIIKSGEEVNIPYGPKYARELNNRNKKTNE